MANNKLKNIITKKITGIVGMILTFAIVIGAVLFNSNLTIAADSLPGIESIRNEITADTNAYRILEIVPNAEASEFGFLVGGQEPLNATDLYNSTTGEWIGWQEYLALHTEDTALDEESERSTKLEAWLNSNSDYINNGSASPDKPMYYLPYVEVDESYEGSDKRVLEGGNISLYSFFVSNGDMTSKGWNVKFSLQDDNVTVDEALAADKPYYMVKEATPLSVTDLTTSVCPYPLHWYVYLTEDDGTTYQSGMTVQALKDAYANSEIADDRVPKYHILKFKLFTALDGAPNLYEIEVDTAVYLQSNAPYITEDGTSIGKGHNLVQPSKNIYYKGGFYSNEYFKQHSLDIDVNKVSDYNVEVVSKTATDLVNMSRDDLNSFLETVDFIYINPGNATHKYDYSSYDLDEEALELIFEKICNEKTPCIVDYALRQQAIDEPGTAFSDTKIHALAVMLMQANYRGILSGGEFTADLSIINTLVGSVVSTNNHNFVNENVMVINSTVTGNDLHDNYHTTKYTNEVVASAYADVLAEIEIENMYREADQAAGYKALSTDIYKSTVVRYIMHFTSQRQTERKTVVNVLEIQPGMVKHKDNSTSTGDFNELTPDTIRNWMGVGKNVTVNIKTVTTNEFVGRIEDINSKYDLIYIGADVYKLWHDNSGDTQYRDTSMNKMIYTNIGDMKKVKAHFAGLLDTDYISGSNRKKVNQEIEARYNGNDISADKHNDLVDYVKGTYPVVIADKLCKNEKEPSSTTVDNCTYLYSFLEKHLSQPNVFRVSDVSGGKNSKFKFYVNRGKLSIGTKVLASEESSVTSGTPFVVPGTIDSSDSTNGKVTYISKENGKYYLKYKFTITNNGAVYNSTRYTAALYLDSNADGKFSEEFEEIPDITLTHVASGKNVSNGQLVAGEQYILTRQVPDSYSGLLTWKVEVTQSNNEFIRDSVIGYTKLYDPTRGPVTIKVLHVHKDSGSYLNLETGIGNGPYNTGTQSILSTLVWGGNYGGVTYEGIDSEYKFEFTSIPNKAFNKSFETGYLYKMNQHGNIYNTNQKFNLMDYDMFILGFYDSYSVLGTSSEDISNNAVNGSGGIKEFIDSGKSVLFAHDTTSFTAIAPDKLSTTEVQDYNGSWIKVYKGSFNCAVWAYSLNKNIRDMVGLDAYGVSLDTKDGINYARIHSGVALKSTDSDTTLFNALTNKLDDKGHYTIGLKALAYKPGSKRKETVPETQGLNYNWMQMWPSTASWNTARYRLDTGAYTVVSEADRVNEGQITTYPYYLPETIKTAPTHAQYYTLDLNADDDGDKETDLVVWYTLGGGNQYDYSPKDVVNNYYIYNKGNITYTGIGHSHNTTTVDEGKLFVNTMVAAYNAALKEPEVTIYESEENLVPTTSFYEYGDVDNKVAFRENTQRMFFSINDLNVIRGTKSATAEYYVALDEDLVVTGTTYTANGVTYPVFTDPAGKKYLQLTSLKTYTSAGAEVASNNLACGQVYYVDIPTSVFDITGVSGQNVNIFMIASKTVLQKRGAITGKITVVETARTYNTAEFIHVELFPLD